MRNTRISFNHSSALSTHCLCAALCFAGLSAPQALALPTGATVVSGHVTTSQPTSTQEVITQTTSKAIVNWSSFDIGTTESVKIIEPSASSIQLDRVTGGSPTQILGSLSANGQVWLVNPNGVFFGPKSQVNVAGLIASTADISNANFLSGNYSFDSAGSASASVINQGTITAAQGGLVALVAPGVVNSGVITAKYGTVALGASQTFSVDFYGDGLYGFAVNSADTQLANDQNGKPLTAAITNSGTVSSGFVYMTADAAANIVSQAINTTGIVQATNATAINGIVILDGGAGDMNVGGTVSGSGDVALKARNASLTNTTITSGHNFAVNTTGNVTMNGSSITATGNLAVDNNGTFSSDTAGVLNGNAVWLHQSPAGSIQNAIDVIGTVGTGGASLWLPATTYALSNEITIGKNLTLNGRSAGTTILDGQNSTRVMEIDGTPSGITVNLNNLTLQHGNGVGTNSSGNGGGLLVYAESKNHANVTVNDSTITNNSSVSAGGNLNGGGGGGIFNDGYGGNAVLTITNSTISANSTNLFGGGLYNNALSSGGTANVTIINSTITSNTAEWGGGIENRGATATVSNSTISGNSATDGGGGLNNDINIVTICDTILIGNLSSGSESDFRNYLGTFNSKGYNLFGQNGNAGGFTGNGTTDILLTGNISTVLKPLGNNGGPTQTMALVPDSPAIDAGDPALIGSLDQRGVVRGSPSAGTGSAADIGAYEWSSM